MKKLWLISAFLLALVVETAVSLSRRRCSGCYSSIGSLAYVDQEEGRPKFDLAEFPPRQPALQEEYGLTFDLGNFPTLQPAIQNPSVEEFPSDLWERLQRIKIDGAATQDGEDAI